MANRRKAEEQKLAAKARQIIDQLTSSSDVQALARRCMTDISSRVLRQAVLQAAVSAPDEVTAALARAALWSGDSDTARVGAELLADMSSSPTAISVLADSLEMDDDVVRTRAVEALESFENPGVLEYLAQAFTDESTPVRRAAATVMSLIVATRYHSLAGPVLEQLSRPESPLSRAVLDNDDEHVRRQVGQAMGFVRAESVLPLLRELGRDEGVEVRQEAALALAGLGTPAALDVMRGMVNDPSYRVVSSALDTLMGKEGPSDQMLEYLDGAFDHEDSEVRRHAVLMLDRFDAEKVRPVLEKAMKDLDFEVARRAAEVLTKLTGTAGMNWLSEKMAGQVAGQRMLTVWEAGNMGIAASSHAATLVSGGIDIGGDLVGVLEAVLVEGSASDKVHAINELSRLTDISDSEAMRAALNDRDSAVRSRAADALTYTRDAGLLVEVVHGHPDVNVRRRAISALRHNPGGRRDESTLSGVSGFSSTRTSGMELFPVFLEALEDWDEGVRQFACEAIREVAAAVGVLPVEKSIAGLSRIAEAERTSFLMREEAERSIDAVREVRLPQFVVTGVTETIEWLESLIPELQAIQPTDGGYSPGRASGSAQRWFDDYEISGEAREALESALQSGDPIPEDAMAPVLSGLAEDVESGWRTLAAGARAVRLIGQAGWEDALEEWREIAQRPCEISWAPGIETARKVALVEVRRALQSSGVDTPESLELGDLGTDDDFVRLHVLRSRCQVQEDRDAAAEMLELCTTHQIEEDYAEPIALAVCAALGMRITDAVEPLYYALMSGDVELRVRTVWKLSSLALNDTVADALTSYLHRNPPEDVGGLVFVLALVNAGRRPGVPLPEMQEGELTWSLLARRAMLNQEGAADRLKAAVRSGEPRDRYQAACYLALARVRTAVPVFASVRDQDAPYLLRAVCAGSSIRRGHPAIDWFAKVLKSVRDRVNADIVYHLCRAVEDVMPVMLDRVDVNAGRFV